MTNDYDHEPLLRYMQAYTKADLAREKPKRFKFKPPGGLKSEYLIYYDDGTWDPEFAVVENYERFMDAVSAFGWQDKFTYNMLKRHNSHPGSTVPQ